VNSERHDGSKAPTRQRPRENAAMKHLHDNHYIYIEPFRPQFPFLVLLGVVVVVIGLTADWLNGLPVQFVGPVLYPIERLLNAAFFPDAQTPLRPNGSALLVLVPTVALFVAVYFAVRAALRAAVRAFRPFVGHR